MAVRTIPTMSLYLKHFGLHMPPFRNTPDTRFFYAGSLRRELLEGVLYAVTGGEAIVKVTGEVGTGKTMLSRMLEKRLPEHFDTVYILNPGVGPMEIRRQIGRELGLQGAQGRSPDIVDLQLLLIERYTRGRQVLVIIDEAQAMSLEALEEIRLLSNLETETCKLLQMVLLGQPELDARLADTRIRQLRERIAHSFELPPLARTDVHAYIRRRLTAAGASGEELFTAEALETIARASRGITRRVNILADRALLAAFADTSERVERRHAQRASQTRDGAPSAAHRSARAGWKLATLAAALTAVALAASLWWPRSQAPGGLPAALAEAPPDALAAADPLPAMQAPADAGPAPEPPAEVPAIPAAMSPPGTGQPAPHGWPPMWQQAEPASVWTIQLAALPDEPSAARHVAALAPLLPDAELFSAPLGEDTELHGVWFGSFASRLEAQSAIAELPVAVRRDQPFPRRPAVFLGLD